MTEQQKVMLDICPKCDGELDTGWECNDCGYDAQDLMSNVFETDEWNELGAISRLLFLIDDGTPPPPLKTPNNFFRHPIRWMQDLFKLVCYK